MSAAEQLEPRVPRTLSEIVEAGLAALADLDDAQGEVTDELGVRLDAMVESIGGKAEAYRAVCLALEFEAAACEDFAQLYIARAKRKRANIDRLKSRLKEALERLGMQKAIGPTGGAAIQRNGAPALVVTVPDHELEQRVPSELLRKRVELDKAELKRRLQAGEAFEFAHLEYGTHLRFR